MRKKKRKFEKVKERQAQEKKEAQQIQSEFNNAQKGIVKSSGQEFSNYKPAKDESGKVITRRGNVVFEFVQSSSKENTLISLTNQFNEIDAIYNDFLIGGIQRLYESIDLIIKETNKM